MLWRQVLIDLERGAAREEKHEPRQHLVRVRIRARARTKARARARASVRVRVRVRVRRG